MLGVGNSKIFLVALIFFQKVKINHSRLFGLVGKLRPITDAEKSSTAVPIIIQFGNNNNDDNKNVSSSAASSFFLQSNVFDGDNNIARRNDLSFMNAYSMTVDEETYDKFRKMKDEETSLIINPKNTTNTNESNDEEMGSIRIIQIDNDVLRKPFGDVITTVFDDSDYDDVSSSSSHRKNQNNEKEGDFHPLRRRRSQQLHRRLRREYNLDMLGISEMHKVTMGENTKICIIDSGVDVSHIDLDETNFEGLNTENELRWNIDLLSHGTHIAGVISAINDNAIEINGIAPQSPIYVVRAFENDGRAFEFASGLVRAVERCAIAGARVINMSFGGYTYIPLEMEGLAELADRYDLLLVAAGGNNGFTAPAIYPANYDSVISVGAIDAYKSRWYGSQANVDLVAPGVDIWSLKSGTLSGIEKRSGTSVACAHITAVAALLWSWKPHASASEIKAALFRTAEKLGRIDDANKIENKMEIKDTEFGYGLIQPICALIHISQNDNELSLIIQQIAISNPDTCPYDNGPISSQHPVLTPSPVTIRTEVPTATTKSPINIITPRPTKRPTAISSALPSKIPTIVPTIIQPPPPATTTRIPTEDTDNITDNNNNNVDINNSGNSLQLTDTTLNGSTINIGQTNNGDVTTEEEISLSGCGNDNNNINVDTTGNDLVINGGSITSSGGTLIINQNNNGDITTEVSTNQQQQQQEGCNESGTGTTTSITSNTIGNNLQLGGGGRKV